MQDGKIHCKDHPIDGPSEKIDFLVEVAGDKIACKCYGCGMFWIPTSFNPNRKGYGQGNVRGKKYGDLPRHCSVCYSKYWNKPHKVRNPAVFN